MSQADNPQISSAADRQGIGASLRRNEDARFLDGKGEYLADLQVPGMAEVSFLRSPVAHGKIRSITVPEAVRGILCFRHRVYKAHPGRQRRQGFQAVELSRADLRQGKIRRGPPGDLHRADSRGGGGHRPILRHRFRRTAGRMGYRRRVEIRRAPSSRELVG